MCCSPLSVASVALLSHNNASILHKYITVAIFDCFIVPHCSHSDFQSSMQHIKIKKIKSNHKSCFHMPCWLKKNAFPSPHDRTCLMSTLHVCIQLHPAPLTEKVKMKRKWQGETRGGDGTMGCYMYLYVHLFMSCVPVLNIQQKSNSLRKKVKMVKVCAWLHASTTLRACSSQAADEANLPVGRCKCDWLNLFF